jgi:hypothetical protein
MTISGFDPAPLPSGRASAPFGHFIINKLQQLSPHLNTDKLFIRWILSGTPTAPEPVLLHRRLLAATSYETRFAWPSRVSAVATPRRAF